MSKPAKNSVAPLITVIVVFHDMHREVERTLFSISRDYQRDIENIDYQVVVLDHGSSIPLDDEMVSSFGSEFVLKRFSTGNPSPIKAINEVVREVYGQYLMISIDGARIFSPGILSWSAKALQLYRNGFVHTLAWHLGPDVQNRSMLNGYDQQVEDQLLEKCKWKEDGYRLFDISTLAGSSERGMFSDIGESNCFALSRQQYLEMGGYHPGFCLPGGGLANLDFFRRAMSDPALMPVRLLGEGTFHQFHGGVATNVPMVDHPMMAFQEEYKQLYGYYWELPRGQSPVILGRVLSKNSAALVPTSHG